MTDRRQIPSVDRAIQALADLPLPRPVAVQIARKVLGDIRAEGAGDTRDPLARVREEATRLLLTRSRPVINGTGVIIHTNLGRSPLGPSAVKAISAAAANYNTLEFDLQSGERGGRGTFAETLLATLCEAEAATVVNNCAAALVLMLRHFTRGEQREVVISRGELVQIGGGFRIPDILESSGATLREVGTTNKTSVEDYRRAINGNTALILRVHRSNFWMEGFVETPAREAVAALAAETKTAFVEDLGSGASPMLAETLRQFEHPAPPEPTPAEVLRAGVDLVCFSGDKLFGGPQAGVIAGGKRHIQHLKQDPFFRALRCDKLVLSGMEATALAHLRGDAEDLPVLRMNREPVATLQARAMTILSSLGGCNAAISVVQSIARIGGGSLPRTELPSVAVEIKPQSPLTASALAAGLRSLPMPVIGYIHQEALRIDVRTVFADQDALLIDAIRAAMVSP